MKINLSTAITLILILHGSLIFPQSPYKLETKQEALLIAGGLGLGLVSLHLESKINSIKFEELQELSRENVNAFDRGATYNWSERASTISDYLLNIMLISPIAFVATDKIRENFGNFITMYIENLFLSFAAVHTTKIFIQRNRPYTYNKNVPLNYRSDRTSRLSFFSGHTTHAFSSAVFLSTIYSEYYPDSKLKPFIWGLSLLSASLTGYLRYASGDHFPTDIIVGAIVGSAIGYFVPLIHKTNKGDELHNGITSQYNNIITLQFVF